MSVVIPDQALRKAINLALGRNAMDSLTRGLMAQLTTLNAVGNGISDLTGLQYAVNLKTANLSNNKLTTITPISGLQLTSLIWTGNPGNPGSTQVPAMPPLAQLILAFGLFGIITYFRRHQNTAKECHPCV
jgi:Leucine-rich repeat (LRR) protein